MRFHDRAADRQTHAHAILFGRDEGFEDFVRILQADAAIPNLDEDGFQTVAFRADEEYFGTVKDRIHRLEPVEQQVEYQLLQLYAIAHNGSQVFS